MNDDNDNLVPVYHEDDNGAILVMGLGLLIAAIILGVLGYGIWWIIRWFFGFL